MNRSVSTSERGFLGELWPDGPPDWYTEFKPQIDAILKGKDVDPAQQTDAMKKTLTDPKKELFRLTKRELVEHLIKLESDRSSTAQELTEKREQLEAEVKKLNEKIDSAWRERDTARSERDEARNERASARKEAAQMESSFESATAQMSVLEEKQLLLQKKYDDVQKTQKETAATLRTTEDQLEQANAKLANVSGKLEETKRQPAGWYWEKFNTPNNWFSLFCLACLVGIVFGVLFWVGEVRGRQKLELFLTPKIERLREDLANGAQDAEDDSQDRREMLCEFERHLGTLQTLTVSGTDHDETTLGEIRNDVFTLIEKGPPSQPTAGSLTKLAQQTTTDFWERSG